MLVLWSASQRYRWVSCSPWMLRLFSKGFLTTKLVSWASVGRFGRIFPETVERKTLGQTPPSVINIPVPWITIQTILSWQARDSFLILLLSRGFSGDLWLLKFTGREKMLRCLTKIPDADQTASRTWSKMPRKTWSKTPSPHAKPHAPRFEGPFYSIVSLVSTFLFIMYARYIWESLWMNVMRYLPI